jgi:hypothetical protein
MAENIVTQQATCGKEIPPRSNVGDPIPFESKGTVKPSGKSWAELASSVVNGQGLKDGKPRNEG